MGIFNIKDILVLAGVGVAGFLVWNHFQGRSVNEAIQDTPFFEVGFDAGTNSRDFLCAQGYNSFCDTKTTQFEKMKVGHDDALLLGVVGKNDNVASEANFMTSNGCYFKITGPNVNQEFLHRQCELFKS